MSGKFALVAGWIGTFAIAAFGMSQSLSDGAVADALRETLSAENEEQRSGVGAFYAAREYRPFWFDKRGPNVHTEELLTAVAAAPSHGLDPEGYALSRLRKELAGVRGKATPEAIARLELELSEAFSAYANDLYGGRLNPNDLSRNWALRAKEVGAGSALENAARSGVSATLAGLVPVAEPYRALQKSLESLRATAAQGGWPQVPAGPSMRLGHQGKRVAVLWKRLTGRDDRSRFDKELADRVKAFQKARALPIDGAVGPGTLAALNEPVEKIIERVEVGLERLRWAPRKLPARHLWVDLAAFTLTLREDESKELEMRVIIGDEGKATPVFHSKITYLVLNPDWVLPKSIALELLPKIQANPDYLRRNGFTVRSLKSEEDLDPGSVDWAALSEKTFPYRLIQAPGPANPLGKVKFMFPNEFAVYLHDTPADALFEARVRTFSHGCIRLEKPLELAERLLKSNSPAWTRSDLDGAIAKRKSVTVPLEHPIPVFLWYQTAWVDEASGALMLRPDVYGWDNKVRHELSRL